MFKIFFTMARPRQPLQDATAKPVWLRDPLAHPAIAQMDSRALGDLPFGLFRPAATWAEPAGSRPSESVSRPTGPRPTGPCA